MSLLARIVALSLAWIAGACSSYEVAHQEVALRYLPAEDALLVLEVQRGITASTIQPAVKALEYALRGGRCYPPEQGFFWIDLDSEPLENSSDEDIRAFCELASLVKVEAARVFRDERNQLGFVRLTRIDRARRLLEIVNTWLNSMSVHDVSDVDDEPFEPEFPIYDRATLEAWVQAQKRGHAWLSVRDGAIVLDLPMSEANAALFVDAIARGQVHESVTSLAAQISSLRIVDGHALVGFCEAHSSVVRFESTSAEVAVDETLTDALRGRGVSIRGSNALEFVRQRFSPATTPVPAGK